MVKTYRPAAPIKKKPLGKGKQSREARKGKGTAVKSARDLGVAASPFIESNAKTHKGRKILDARAPKISENPKKSIVMKGKKSSATLNTLLRELHAMRGTNMSQLLMKKTHDVCPMDDASMIERTSVKYDASLFMLGSHQKKRPNNLVMGRCFDGHVLDMFEFGVEDYKSCGEFPTPDAIGKDLKPVLIFQGEPWENNDRFKRFKNLLIGKLLPLTRFRHVQNSGH